MSKHTNDWFGDYANVVTLIQWMCENNYELSEISRAVEKPWNYEELYLCAELDLDDNDLADLLLDLPDDEVLDQLRDRKRSQELQEAIELAKRMPNLDFALGVSAAHQANQERA